MESAKRDDAKLVVLGCMAQRLACGDRSLPAADAVLGSIATASWSERSTT